MLGWILGKISDKQQKGMRWSYYLIICLAILTNFIGYAGSVRVVENELKASGTRSVTYAKNICDGYFTAMFSSAYGILQSNSMQPLLAETEMSGYERTAYLQNVSRDLLTMSSSNPIVQQSYIFTRSTGISQEDIGSTRLMYHAHFRDVYDTYEEWEREVFQARPYSFRQRRTSVGETRMYAFYTLSTLQGTCVAVIELSPEMIDTAFKREENQFGERFFITDQQGIVLFAPAEEAVSKLNFETTTDSSIQYIGGQRRIMARIPSDYSELCYVRTMPVNLYLRSIRGVQIAFVVGYLLCLLLTIPVARFFARRMEVYRQNMKKKLEAQNVHMRTGILADLLQGKTAWCYSPKPEEYGLRLHGRWLGVTLFESGIQSDGQMLDHTDDTELTAWMSEAYAQVSNGSQGYFCKIGTTYAGVLSMENPPEPALLQRDLETLCDCAFEQYGIEFVCAVSQLVQKPEQLGEAWEQAREIIGFRFLGDERTVYLYDDMLDTQRQFVVSSEDERALSEALVSGDAAGAEALIENLFNNKGKVEELTLHMLNVLVFEIINIVIRTAIQTNNKAWLDYKELYLLPVEISSQREIPNVREKIIQYIEQLCSKSRAVFETTENGKYKKVIAYIQQNYADVEMHVNQLADIFQMNRSFFSRDFKEKVGVSVADYIVECRIAQARRLLDTDKTITQIATETGFSGAAVFRNAFKKVENMTPGQYRKMRMAAIEKTTETQNEIRWE